MNIDKKKVDKLFDDISNLTIDETLQIVDKFYKAFPFLKNTVSLSNNQNNSDKKGSDDGEKINQEKNKTKDLYLESFDINDPVNRAKVILLVSKLKGITASQAQKELKKLPFVIKNNIDEKSCNEIKDKFKSLKAELSLK
jgi:ribosomal protein L7/L12